MVRTALTRHTARRVMTRVSRFTNEPQIHWVLILALDLDPTYPDPERHGGYKGTLECGVFKPPYVLSSSYGGAENLVPIAYQRRQCNEWLKLGLQGTSVLFASGDAGVADDPVANTATPFSSTPSALLCSLDRPFPC